MVLWRVLYLFFEVQGITQLSLNRTPWRLIPLLHQWFEVVRCLLFAKPSWCVRSAPTETVAFEGLTLQGPSGKTMGKTRIFTNKSVIVRSIPS